jgi:hypothetical protein
MRLMPTTCGRVRKSGGARTQVIEKHYRQEHPDAAERNRRQQRRRDQKRRLVNLAKINLALDLKHEASEVWFVGPVVKDLAKNNLAQSKVFISRLGARLWTRYLWSFLNSGKVGGN